MIRGIIEMLIVGVCWTSFGIIMGFAPKRKVDVGMLLFFSALAAITVCGIISLASGLPQNVPTIPYLVTFFSLFICGALNYVQLYFMSKAMENGPNGIIWSLVQSAFVFPFLTGVLFCHAKCSLLNAIGIAVIILALFIFGLSQNNEAKGKWKLMSYLSMSATGIAQILSNLPSYYTEAESINSNWRATYFAFGLAFGTVLGSIIVHRQKLLPALRESICSKMMWCFVIVLEGFEILASIFLLYPGMNRLANAGVGAIAYPLIVASGIVAFELYSLVILREKRTFAQLLALMLVLFGIAALCR